MFELGDTVVVAVAVAVPVGFDGGGGLLLDGSSGCGPRRIMVLLEKQVHLQNVGAAREEGGC